jgi:NAD(P)-dependent dehydrogenase (short-subunit alcohol dehydrogenase family)
MEKFVVITGSSGDIGSCLVQEYLDDKFFVIGIDKKIKGVEIENFIEIEADLLTFAQEYEYQKKIIKKINNILKDKVRKLIIINNAAVQIVKNVSEVTWLDWNKSLSINTIAPFFLTTGLLDHLMKSHGHVINISSIHSNLTKKDFSIYAASKSALDSITKSMALELSSHGISVNAISPAAIKTKMLLGGFNSLEDLKQLEDYHPAGKIALPTELASFVKSITDFKGSFLTGSIIDFNGGIGAKLHDPG